jgi:hypothetical protein
MQNAIYLYMPQHLLIELGHDSSLTLRFRLLDNPITELWLERMSQRDQWPLDHPDRFYGFGTPAEETARAIASIEHCINIINSYEYIIRRKFTFDQNCLNYMHNIFEQYHGLLDQQNTRFWHGAPVPVREALATLNLAVHRCEGILGANPHRFVCTWYGMPKTHQLNTTLQRQHGTMRIKFGTVYLNYAEIGKTVEDLAHDNDQYIGDDAFRPFDHYSADFNVAFYNRDHESKLPGMAKYIQEHQEFFLARGIDNVYNTRALPLRFPLAELEETMSRSVLLDKIGKRQLVTRVTIE